MYVPLKIAAQVEKNVASLHYILKDCYALFALDERCEFRVDQDGGNIDIQLIQACIAIFYKTVVLRRRQH